CMSANNETGAVLPIDTLKLLITAANSPALLHVDATQSFGKYPIYPKACGIDLMTFSSHKIHGPKGVGALYKSKSVRILPILHGGEQQGGLRPGTEPTVLIAGFAAAVRDIGNMAENESRVRKLRDYIAERLMQIDGAVMNSPNDSSAYVLNISLPGFKSETLLHYLDSRGICVSSGSACSKGKQSHVLTALGFDKKRADSALRISFSKYNTIDEADLLINSISDAVKTLIRVK
ncbi:MAG: aminotransferase class V-fold PLP-dependent enzyme, partial [Acutalibacteraceae bacterium]|nr:aminotransferase class V-fold PLP-dependent enzyme [Acutalibacteraceae bacterium]